MNIFSHWVYWVNPVLELKSQRRSEDRDWYVLGFRVIHYTKAYSKIRKIYPMVFLLLGERWAWTTYNTERCESFYAENGVVHLLQSSELNLQNTILWASQTANVAGGEQWVDESTAAAAHTNTVAMFFALLSICSKFESKWIRVCLIFTLNDSNTCIYLYCSGISDV